MKKRIYAVLILLITAALGTACAFQGDKTEESEETETENYRVTITEEEMEAGYASFQMDKYIYFDASITPTSVYENGVNSYFLISNCVVEDENTDDEDSDSTDGESGEEGTSGADVDSSEDSTLGADSGSGEKGESGESGSSGEGGESDDSSGNEAVVNDENTIYGYSMEEFYDLLAEYSTVDFAESGTDWRPDITYLGLSTDLAYDPRKMYPYGFLSNYLSDPSGNLSYATAEEQGAKILEFLEELTGMEISEDWTCYTYSRENLEEVMAAKEEITGSGNINYYLIDDIFSDDDPIPVEVEEFYEFYSFWFTYEVNGIPLTLYRISGYQVKIGADETPGEGLTEWGSHTYIISSDYYYLAPLWITASEEGILYADIRRTWSLGDVYKEAEEVRTASEILETCEGYLQSEINVDTLTVTDMSLVYDLGVTDEDKEDGVVEVVLRPYWVIDTYNSWSLTHKQFVFDARTGNLVDEQENSTLY